MISDPLLAMVLRISFLPKLKCEAVGLQIKFAPRLANA